MSAIEPIGHDVDEDPSNPVFEPCRSPSRTNNCPNSLSQQIHTTTTNTINLSNPGPLSNNVLLTSTCGFFCSCEYELQHGVRLD
ncbi:LOW QUALITY PROTEIN: hypothetical protein IFM46972_06614 [Aspergillus udagawae]|uniref:Uncharacterized protein n=1 Tax=Aspergillus udagawae TaxID=91492 RepID=A0A8H3P4Y9_9EURO|nr:LOW QUALITY PROTEIN: hypothetical protein IFM46972_06614 [Aspergillus udagawae]